MYTSMWFVSVVAILVAEVRTGTLLQKDAEIRRCAQCAAGDAACAAGRPCAARGLRCATVAVSPEFTSILTCASGSVYQPCSLHRSPQLALELTCTCPSHRCNAPFTAQLRNHLLNFTSTHNSTTNLTETFFKSFTNASKEKLYDMITTKALLTQNNTPPVTFSSTTVEHSSGLNAPRAEALKHEATEPSDDDEDEGEGSGSYEDSRLRRPASAPAAPSSYLPANGNSAPPLLVNFLLMTGILFVPL